MVNFGQILKDRIAELENELRIAQSFQKVSKFNYQPKIKRVWHGSFCAAVADYGIRLVEYSDVVGNGRNNIDF